MPSVSKSQQRFFGLVRKCQKTGKCASAKIKKIANNISEKDAKDFAKTKHEGLPNKKKKRKKFSEWVSYKHPEFNEIAGALATLALGTAAVAKTAYDRSRGRRGYQYQNGNSDQSSSNKTYKYVNSFLKQNWNWNEIIRQKIIVFGYYYPDDETVLNDNDVTVVSYIQYLKIKNKFFEKNKNNKFVSDNEKINYFKNKNNWDDLTIKNFYDSIKKLGKKPEEFGGKDVRIS